MMKWLKDQYTKYNEVISYLFFGVLATIVNIGIFYFFDTLLNTPYLIANGLSIIGAILFAFFTNKKYVFKSNTTSKEESFREFILFVGFRLASGVFDMLSMYILVSLLTVDTNISKILTQFIVVVVNYVFSKVFIFKQEEGEHD
ncbi:GtrA family protein [Marinilactibacillus psychrotolerans]|uniref:Cell wall teichoic acid glycosylation protein n=1 Tax=Marinilactibacillus psychrotolerans TaxID=191770 RepID=A0AAV3WXW0_9LACT|nr:GtrA family protein [Marinilactibacillus psychrotolerans]GEL67996.1 teichoic acid glycosylation protein GtcA [Marinilactibacillus psychrotolerans]GEQ36579.1 cell wall teichoic acid glycosylation protein [Marinilactibacillus psychrotolerans]SDD31306.1 Putative flippase GtrA (transmembrane translocase of bactoprenol-linked glucose) [Marinilactibacillus psychrotolerans]